MIGLQTSPFNGIPNCFSSMHKKPNAIMAVFLKLMSSLLDAFSKIGMRLSHVPLGNSRVASLEIALDADLLANYILQDNAYNKSSLIVLALFWFKVFHISTPSLS